MISSVLAIALLFFAFEPSASFNQETNSTHQAEMIQKMIGFINSGSQYIADLDWQAASNEYSSAIALYDSFDEVVQEAILSSHLKILGTLYSQRGYCKYRLHDIEGADEDWRTADRMGCDEDDAVKKAKSQRFNQIADNFVSEFHRELDKKVEETQERLAARAEARMWEEEEEEVPSLSESLVRGLQEIADSYQQNEEAIQEILRRREKQKDEILAELNQRRKENLQRLKEEQERRRVEQDRLRKEQEEAQRRRQEQIEQEAKYDERNAAWSPSGMHQAGYRGTVNLITPKGFFIAIMSWRVVEEKKDYYGKILIVEYYINNQSRFITLDLCRGTWWYKGQVAGTTGDKLMALNIPPKGEARGRARLDVPTDFDSFKLMFNWSSAKKYF